MYLGMYSTVGGFCLGVMEKLRVHHQQLSPSRPRAKYNYDVSSHHQSVSYSLHVVLLSPQPLTVQLRGCELAASRSRALENGGTLESPTHIPEKLLSQPFLGGGRSAGARVRDGSHVWSHAPGRALDRARSLVRRRRRRRRRARYTSDKFRLDVSSVVVSSLSPCGAAGASNGKLY